MSAIRFSGVLGRDAESRVATDGTAWVYLEVHQGAGRLFALAKRRIGSGPAAQLVAHNSARHLRAGARVTVHAASVDVAHSPHDHLVLLGVDWIEHQPVVSRHEPAEREGASA